MKVDGDTQLVSYDCEKCQSVDTSSKPRLNNVISAYDRIIRFFLFAVVSKEVSSIFFFILVLCQSLKKPGIITTLISCSMFPQRSALWRQFANCSAV